MKVHNLETMHCDAGWRNYHFLKLTTESGVVGWSEYSEAFGSAGVTGVIQSLAGRVVGQDVREHERIFAELHSLARPAYGGVVAEGLGAIENAMLDAEARELGVPCYVLLGGKVRERVRVYWSHCATWRIAQAKWYPPAVTSLAEVAACGAKARERGFSALKTNIFLYDQGRVQFWQPGFANPFQPDLNVDRQVLRDLRRHLEALREGAGPDVDILLDLNFNARTEGYLKILRALADFDLFWVEIDTRHAQALAHIRQRSSCPISSGETLFGIREFLPFFAQQAMDVAIVDAVWNGVWQSMKIAAAADAFEMNVAPHNYYGHLSSFMNVHFAAAVPNLRIMEIDIDRLAWDADLFTHAPLFEQGHFVVPDRPGWGTEPVEEAIRAHPVRSGGA